MGYLPFQAGSGVHRGESDISNGFTPQRVCKESNEQHCRQVLGELLFKGRSRGMQGTGDFFPAEVIELYLDW